MDYPSQTEQEMLLEEPYDASDKKSVNNKRKKAAALERERLDFVAGIMSLPQGRKWMFGLMTDLNLFGNPIVPGDTYATYHNLGAQNFGKKLLQDINLAAPDDYVKMMKESREAK